MKNVYRFRGLFKGSLKLDKQENIISTWMQIWPNHNRNQIWPKKH